jgi:mannose-6-phosphate isomerase-like protein (cupin superfamily)
MPRRVVPLQRSGHTLHIAAAAFLDQPDLSTTSRRSYTQTLQRLTRAIGAGSRRSPSRRTRITSSVAVFESQPPPGVLTTPPHLHHDYTEAFYVLAGEIEFRVAERTVRGSAGAFVHVPPGVVNGFHNPGQAKAKLLVLIYPATGLGIVGGHGCPDVRRRRASACGRPCDLHEVQLRADSVVAS